jgi:hypothetical protein
VRKNAWLLLLAAGCAGPPELDLRVQSLAAVGEPVPGSVSRTMACGGKVFGGPSDPTDACLAKYHQLTALLDASCDNDACTIENVSVADNGLISFTLVGNQPGPTTFHIRARVDDGSEMSDSVPLTLAVPTGLHVDCDPTVRDGVLMRSPDGQCGGAYPVFTGSSWRWNVSFESDAGPIAASGLSVEVQGGSNVTAQNQIDLQAGGATGAVDVVISSRQLTRTIPVRVVSPADVVAAELRLVTGHGDIEQLLTDAGAVPDALWFPPKNGRQFDGDGDAVTIRPRLTLADGSVAYGGGGLFASDHPDVCRAVNGGFLLQQSWINLETWGAGSAVLSATIGSAQVSWPVTVTAPPP